MGRRTESLGSIAPQGQSPPALIPKSDQMSQHSELTVVERRNDPEPTAGVLDAPLEPDNEPSDGLHSMQTDLGTEIRAAIDSGHYLIAVWRLAEDRVHLHRELRGFPESDFPIAEQLLRDDLTKCAMQSTLHIPPIDESKE